jgi:nicotinate-nucleotide adenylyltransferase
MRIGFFGGSFDPPHCGHLAIARATADRCALSRILLAPTAKQPLKPDGPVASFHDRLAMVRLLCQADPRLEASSLDGPRPDQKPNYTIDALERLRQTLSIGDTITVLIGIDAFLDIRRWRSPDELLRDFDWAVISRPGFTLESIDGLNLTLQQRERVRLIDSVAETVSATALRASLQAGEDIHSQLPATVLAYIREHRLYGAPD